MSRGSMKIVLLFIISVILIVIISFSLFSPTKLQEPLEKQVITTTTTIKRINASKGEITEETTTTQQTTTLIKTQTRNEILIYSDNYKPSELVISVGEKVFWVNRDDKEHLLIVPHIPLEKTVFPGEDFSLGFYEQGTYEFYDGEKGEMRGTIIVK